MHPPGARPAPVVGAASLKRGCYSTERGCGKDEVPALRRDERPRLSQRKGGSSGGSVVVNDAPALVRPAEDQREQAAGVVLGEDELPTAADQRVVGAEHFDVEFAEGQFAHRTAVGLV